MTAAAAETKKSGNAKRKWTADEIERWTKRAEEGIGLAVKLAVDYHRRFYSVPLDDLRQAAFVGLVCAARSFDPARGFKFSTLAANCMFKEMARLARQEIRSQRQFPPDAALFAHTMHRDEHERFDLDVPIHKALSMLKKNDRRLLERLFGLNGTASRTLDDVGQEMGVTKQRVEQLKRRALGRCRARLRYVGVDRA